MYQKLLHSIFGSFIVLLKSFVAYTQYDSLYGFGDVISVPVSAEGSYKTSQSPLMIKETRNCATSLWRHYQNIHLNSVWRKDWWSFGGDKKNANSLKIVQKRITSRREVDKVLNALTII